MSLITIRTSSEKVDNYLSGIFFMAEKVLNENADLSNKEHWFTVTIDQGDDDVITDVAVQQNEESDIT
tara:strand:- start:447 stop:650 length:204 start_codon:yes stop_codon:yes gene_type:complete